MTLYERIENSIVSRLTPLVSPALKIMPLPETEAGYAKVNSENRVTIMYLASKYGEQDSRLMSIGKVAQEETVYIEVSIESRKFRGDGGIFSIWEAVRALLIGFTPDDCDKLRLEKFMMSEKDKHDSTWGYVAVFYCKRLLVEKEDDEIYPLIKQINFDYEPS